MNAASSADAFKELQGCTAKRAKNTESEGHEIKAVTNTRLRAFVPLRLLDTS